MLKLIKKNILIIFCQIFLLVPLLVIYAQNISISVSLNKQNFIPGDTVEAKVFFTNVANEQLKGRIFADFIAVNPGLPPAPQAEDFSLAPKEKSKTFVFKMGIIDSMPDGLYKAVIDIQDEKGLIIAKKEAPFIVSKTKKIINTDINICGNEECKENKAVFISGEDVYFKMNPIIKDLTIRATLKIPSQKIENIIFKGGMGSYSLKNADEGNYSLWIVISGEGYIDKKIERNFAVLAKQAEINSVSMCNGDSKCDGQENIQNCPQDCLPRPQKPNEDVFYKIAVIAVGIIAVIIIGISFYFRKKKNDSVIPQ